MFGLGTIINAAAIVLGGIIGLLCGKKLNARHSSTMNSACGVSVLFLGISGAMKGMLAVNADGSLSAVRSMMVILALVLGAAVGELINIEGLFERFGEWIKKKTGNGADGGFVNAFVSSSFVVCIGAMAIIGALEDGLNGDITILTEKAILDFVIVLIMAASLGKGAVFSAVPVALLQGAVTLFAKLIEPLMTDAAILNLSTVGNILIFCIGINLLWGKKVKVANFLPAVVFAVAFAFLPFEM